MKHYFFLIVTVIAPCVHGGEPVVPKTQISGVGDLVASEKFDRAESFATKGTQGIDGWRPGIGQWSIVDEAAYAIQEGPSDKRPNGHEAVCEHLTDLGDLILDGEFKLGASPQVGFVCRDTNSPRHLASHYGRNQR